MDRPNPPPAMDPWLYNFWAYTVGGQGSGGTGTDVFLRGDGNWSSTLTGNLTVNGNEVIGGTLNVTGLSTLTNLSVTGNTTIGDASGDTVTVNSAAWTLANAVTVTGTWANLGSVTTIDINGGTIDGAVIGGASAAAGTFTNLTSTGNTTIGDASGDALIISPGQVTWAQSTTTHLNSHLIAGKLGVGTAPLAGVYFYVTEGANAVTGIGQSGILSNVTFTAAATTSEVAISTQTTGAASSHTTVTVAGVAALDHIKGASQTVTNSFGFLAVNRTATATIIAGYSSQIASGSGKWNIYASGTADNAFAGNVRIGSVVAPTVALDVTGAALISTTLGVTGVTSLAAGAVNAPGLYLAADTTSGLYRIGSNNIGVAISGAKVIDVASTGVAVTGTLTFTSGQIALARGGTHADLSATGGANQVLKQSSSGADITVGTLDVASITTGQLALARGGTHADLSATGGANQVLQQISVGGDVTVGTLNAAAITAGTLALARGGVHADLSATGGANQVLQQSSSGADITVGTLDAASIAAGTMATARLGSGSASIETYLRGDQAWAKIPRLIYEDAANTDFTMTNSNTNIFSQSLAGGVAGDQIILDLYCSLLNNSGLSRAYTFTVVYGGFTPFSATGSINITNNATSRGVFWVRVVISIKSTSLTNAAFYEMGTDATPAGTIASFAINKTGAGWNTTSSDMTGTQTFSLGVTSASATATQTLTVHAVKVTKGTTT